MLSTVETIGLTAVVGAVTGAVAGALAARRSIRRGQERRSQRARADDFGRSVPHQGDAVIPPWRGRRMQMPSPKPVVTVREAASSPDQPIHPTRRYTGASASALAGRPTAPRPAIGPTGTLVTDSSQPRIAATTAQALSTGSAQPALRVTTVRDDVIHELPAQAELRIGPRDSDVPLPFLTAELLLSRAGPVWTIQNLGPVKLDVTIDRVPLTSVPMPWTAERPVRVGAVTLNLHNVAGSKPAFEESAILINGRSDICAARAGSFCLALGISDDEDASIVAGAALTAFDPRLLDPARRAADAALNVTFAVREAQRGKHNEAIHRRPGIAVLGFDAQGQLRACANFEVSVWTVDQGNADLISSYDKSAGEGEILPLEVRQLPRRGHKPVIMLVAGGAPTATKHELAVAGQRAEGNIALLKALDGKLAAATVIAAATVCQDTPER